VWLYLPRGYEAVVWLRIRASGTLLSEGRSAEYDAYRKTQLQLLRSPVVLNAALRKPGISSLRMITEQDDPQTWLARTIEPVLQGDAEVMQLKFRGSVADETAKILNAITSCYLDDIVNNSDARYGAAGELKNGNVVWATIELPANITVGDDPHNSYVIARTSHDGSMPFQMTPVVNRLHCTNQINAAMMSGKAKGIYYRVKHSPNSSINPDDIRKAFKVMNEDVQKYATVSSYLRSIEFSNEEFKNFVKRVYPLPSKIEFSPYEMLSAGERTSKTRAERSRSSALNVWIGETDTQHNIKGTVKSIDIMANLLRGWQLGKVSKGSPSKRLIPKPTGDDG
jgi:hypothetical protein